MPKSSACKTECCSSQHHQLDSFLIYFFFVSYSFFSSLSTRCVMANALKQYLQPPREQFHVSSSSHINNLQGNIASLFILCVCDFTTSLMSSYYSRFRSVYVYIWHRIKQRAFQFHHTRHALSFTHSLSLLLNHHLCIPH